MAVDARGNPILSYGSTGGEVSFLKERMNWWGFYDQGHPDAALGADVYGWDLAEAVAKFQQKYQIAPTGVADSATWWAVEQAIQGINPDMATPEMGPMPTAPFSTGLPGQTGGGPAHRDALARLTRILNQYGLGDMTDWVRGKLLIGASEAEITLDLYNQPQFKQRFPAIEARRTAGLNPVSPAEILEYETRGRELLRRAGITANSFTERDYLQGLMTKDVSLAEVNDRLNDGLLRVKNAPPEVRTVFGSYFGTSGDAALAQLFLDPEKALPELEKMASTAVAGGIGERFGVLIAQGIAREIADTGVSDAAIWQGFTQLDTMRTLFQESISETQDMTAEGEGVSAVFGTRPGAQKALADRLGARTSVFRGGGSAAATDSGVVGLGVADR